MNIRHLKFDHESKLTDRMRLCLGADESLKRDESESNRLPQPVYGCCQSLIMCQYNLTRRF